MSVSSAAAAVDARLQELSSLVDGWTRAAVARVGGRDSALMPLLEYHLGWRDAGLHPLAVPAPSGKKLRSGLALLVCESVAGELAPARDAAVAVELVHNFSLVHDDIQDHSDTRRHRPTVWSIWGMEQGINVGDALFALAQATIVGARTAERAAQAADLARACLLLAEGQYLDLELQRGALPLTPDAYLGMIERKTGALFACACRLGARAAGAGEARCDAFADYGLALGVAFQEQDDVLGVWGNEAETGKPAAADVVSRKKALPAALALARADAPAWLRGAYAGQGDLSPTVVAQVIAFFDASGIRVEAEQRVAVHYQAALAALDAAAPTGPAAAHLRAVCDLLLRRRA
ncbi:MAG: polyprenyl synthetase family protein [Chloroflexi bacterium]|nr:polyprenyl synthetase family protein [Chloroflexota bacterium]